MKRFGLFLLVTMAAAIFTSCNDSDGDYPRLSAFATVKPLENNDFFVVLDDGKTVYPGDKSRIGSYKAEEGQRVIKIGWRCPRCAVCHEDYIPESFIRQKKAIFVEVTGTEGEEA